MGAVSDIKKAEVSQICAGLDKRVGAFRNRTLGHTEFPAVVAVKRGRGSLRGVGT